ncbi:MAG: hypothetical protein P8X74_22790 [Reinekea sp.]
MPRSILANLVEQQLELSEKVQYLEKLVTEKINQDKRMGPRTDPLPEDLAAMNMPGRYPEVKSSQINYDEMTLKELIEIALRLKDIPKLRIPGGGVTDPGPFPINDIGRLTLSEFLGKIRDAGIADSSADEINQLDLTALEKMKVELGSQNAKIQSLSNLVNERISSISQKN